MKGTIMATAALVVLALGGSPTAALVLDNDTPSSSDSTAPTSVKASDRTQAPQPGPPVWADGDGHAKQGNKHAGQLKGWARNDDPGRATNSAKADKADKAGKSGNGHGRAVRAWAHCVADYSREQSQDAGGRKAAADVCGQKPRSPGQTKTTKQKRAQRPGGDDSSSPAR